MEIIARLKQSFGSLAVVLITTVVLSGAAAAGPTLIEVTAKGRINGSYDATNVLGYGASGSADGHRVTMIYRFFASDIPQDVYGGGRFPYEADYFTDGNSATAASWISSEIRFDSGLVFKSTDYVGDEKTTDQVKVMDRAGGAAFDYFGVHDNIADKVSTGGIRHLMSGARVQEYVQKIVVGLAPDQKIRWRPDGDGSEIGLGDFRIYDVLSGAEAYGTVILESMQSREIRTKGR